jgi:lipoate-protein ligase A
MKKVNLELRPYTALAIVKFCREFINDENKRDKRFAAIHESVQEYEDEVYKKISMNQLEDAILECMVNDLTERHPPKYA